MGWRDIMGLRNHTKHSHNPQNSEENGGSEDFESSEHTPQVKIPPARAIKSDFNEWRRLKLGGAVPPSPPAETAQVNAHKSRVVDWLNANPASSPPESCALCTGPETWGNTLLPFGVGPHAWLHSNCWPSWRDGRIAEAEAAAAINSR